MAKKPDKLTEARKRSDQNLAQAHKWYAAWKVERAKVNALVVEVDNWRQKFFTRQKQYSRLRRVWWRRLWWALRRPQL